MSYRISRVYILLIASLVFFSSISFVSSNKASIKVNITNIENSKGQVIVALYTNEADFPKKPFLSKTNKIIDGKSVVIFDNIKKGKYAIAIIHDENSNGKLDFNILGIPSENTAASNNAKGLFGPPSWEDAVFTVENGNVIQEIEM